MGSIATIDQAGSELQDEGVERLHKILQMLDEQIAVAQNTIGDLQSQRREVAGILAGEQRGSRSFLRKGVSAAEANPQDAIEALEYKNLEDVLGRRGLGFRMIGQLTNYSRDALEQQLRAYEERALDVDGAPRLEGDIDDELAALEGMLELRGETLKES